MVWHLFVFAGVVYQLVGRRVFTLYQQHSLKCWCFISVSRFFFLFATSIDIQLKLIHCAVIIQITRRRASQLKEKKRILKKHTKKKFYNKFTRKKSEGKFSNKHLEKNNFAGISFFFARGSIIFLQKKTD